MEQEIEDNLSDILLDISDRGVDCRYYGSQNCFYIYINSKLTDRLKSGLFETPPWLMVILRRVKSFLSDHGYRLGCSVRFPAEWQYLGDIEELDDFIGLVHVIKVEIIKEGSSSIWEGFKYLKPFNKFKINEGLSEKSYIYDIEDILQELDMVDIPAGSVYKQDIKFTIDKNLDEDRILRINIFGSEDKRIQMSAVADIIERLKSYLKTIGCKLAIKYQWFNDEWTDIKPVTFKKILIGVRLNLYKTLQATYSQSNYFLLLNDKNTVVVLDKEMPQGNRTYYITFKGVDSNSRYSTLKFEYMVNSRDFINFKIHDNHGNLVEWNKLSYLLNAAGIDYAIFNNGFGYMEGDFNNQTYDQPKTKKFFDI